jgi:hypothetical protein
MRFITNYRADPADTTEPLVLVGLDGSDAYGITHHYALIERGKIPAKTFATGVLPPSQYRQILRNAPADILLQADAEKTTLDPNKAVSGLTDVMLLGIALDHLQARQASAALASEQQASAIADLQRALTSLQQRSV